MPAKERYEQLLREESTSSSYREEISLCPLLFFHWMTETFKAGNCRPLQICDLLPIEEQNKTRVLTEKLQKNWNDEKKACCGKDLDCGDVW